MNTIGCVELAKLSQKLLEAYCSFPAARREVATIHKKINEHRIDCSICKDHHIFFKDGVLLYTGITPFITLERGELWN